MVKYKINSHLNKYTLLLAQKDEANQYILNKTKNIFITGIALTILRIIRLLISITTGNNYENFFFFT